MVNNKTNKLEDNSGPRWYSGSKPEDSNFFELEIGERCVISLNPKNKGYLSDLREGLYAGDCYKIDKKSGEKKLAMKLRVDAVRTDEQKMFYSKPTTQKYVYEKIRWCRNTPLIKDSD